MSAQSAIGMAQTLLRALTIEQSRCQLGPPRPQPYCSDGIVDDVRRSQTDNVQDGNGRLALVVSADADADAECDDVT